MTKVTKAAEGGVFARRRNQLEEVHDNTGVALTTIGQDLRAARLARGEDLAKVSQILKIRKHHIEALEEDRIDDLPGRTYATGFIRAYADYLGLDPAAAVERFKTENIGRGEEPHFTPYIDEEQADRRMPYGWIAIAILLLAFVVYGVYFVVSGSGRSAQQPVAPVPPHLMDENAPPPPPASQPPASQQAAPMQSTTAVPAAVPATAPPAAAPLVSAAAPPLPQGQTYGLKNSNPRIILRAHESTSVEVSGANGMIFINRTLQPGDTYRVPNRTGMKLTTPNAGAVEVQLDGGSVGMAGVSGQSAQDLSLDPQAVMDRHNTSAHP
ncbi:MAG TPA: helix-turn-helix domain-containing protein [Rhizomicrobium sp.]|jgi:cytoskeleton protein RodZ|nr:helix-turn-helix domain-containing protein [Rhizomicrobium sp.]